MDQVVDGYGPVVDGLENDIDEIEGEVFSGNPGVSRRIYKLSREVIEFQRAAKPLTVVLEHLTEDERLEVDPEVRRYLRDVRDHALRVIEKVDGFRELLSDILSVNHTLVGISQNDQAKKISAWAAILFAPTLVAGIYGMNFNYMPELHWFFGYPYALALMVVIGFTLYFTFRRRGWL
jgi:magnesium transporter